MDVIPHDPERHSSPLRLLPWATPEGKRCYLSTGDAGGYLSRVADDVEDLLLATGADVLDLAGRVLDDEAAPIGEVRFAAVRLAECLSDALRIAESRGLRLPAPEPEADGTGPSPGAG